MTRHIRSLGVVAAAAVAGLWGGTLALAQSPAPSGPNVKRVEKFDANKNGKLEPAERQAAFEQRKARWEEFRKEALQQFDANKDGQLDDAERKKMHEERSAAHFKELDTNKDGQLSLVEFQSGMARMHAGKGPMGMGGKAVWGDACGCADSCGCGDGRGGEASCGGAEGCECGHHGGPGHKK